MSVPTTGRLHSTGFTSRRREFSSLRCWGSAEQGDRDLRRFQESHRNRCRAPFLREGHGFPIHAKLPDEHQRVANSCPTSPTKPTRVIVSPFPSPVTRPPRHSSSFERPRGESPRCWNGPKSATRQPLQLPACRAVGCFVPCAERSERSFWRVVRCRWRMERLRTLNDSWIHQGF